jgi:hypothetical protein
MCAHFACTTSTSALLWVPENRGVPGSIPGLTTPTNQTHLDAVERGSPPPPTPAYVVGHLRDVAMGSAIVAYLSKASTPPSSPSADDLRSTEPHLRRSKGPGRAT